MNLDNLPVKLIPFKTPSEQIHDLTSDLYSVPNPEYNYHYSPIIGFYRVFGYCKNISYLMKLVLCVKKFPNDNVLGMIKKEVLTNKDTLNAQTSTGVTALMIAAMNSNGDSSIDVVRLLIELGAGLEFRSDIGYTALTYASVLTKKFSSFDVVTLLLNNGADLHVRNCHGETILSSCARNCNELCSVEMIPFLVGYGIDVDAVNNHGETALHMCAKHIMNSSNSAIQSLLDNRANPNIVCENGNHAFSYVFNFSINYDKFIKNGLDINFQDQDGKTFIMKLCDTESMKTFQTERLKKIIIDAKINNLKKFYAFGPDLTIIDNLGNSFIMYFCEAFDFYMLDTEFLADVLLKSKSVLQNRNKLGLTVYDYVKTKLNITDKQLQDLLNNLVPQLCIEI